MAKKSLLARVVAGFIVVTMYCFNTVALTGFALTASTTDAKAHNGGRSRGRGRRGRWRGRGRGRGYWWPGACHIPGTSLWYAECW